MPCEDWPELPPPESESDFFSNCLQFSPHCFRPALASEASCRWENVVHENRGAICTCRPNSGQGRAVDFCQGELQREGGSLSSLEVIARAKLHSSQFHAESFFGIDMDGGVSRRSLCLCGARSSSRGIDQLHLHSHRRPLFLRDWLPLLFEMDRRLRARSERSPRHSLRSPR